MIPVLFEAGATDFESNGIGALADCTSCIVTEVRNGSYELQMEYPVNGIHFDSLKISNVIKAVPAVGKAAEPFRIYKVTKPLRGIVTVYAEHISYHLSFIPVAPFAASNVQEALTGLEENAVEACPFTFWTDKSTDAKFEVTKPASLRSVLGGTSGSILDVYGGEYEFAGYAVKLHANRGTDRGVSLRYGKNITDIEQEENIENTITGIYPYWIDTDGNNLVTLPEKIVSCEKADHYPFRRTIPYDFSSEFEEAPTEEQLRQAAQSYIKKNGIGVPKVSIKVSFITLAQAEEYKDIAILENVQLCDTVTVQFERLGILATAKVVKTVYNVLKERYDSVEVGEARSNLSNTIQEQEYEIKRENRERERVLKKLSDRLASSSGMFMTKEIQENESTIYYMHDKQMLQDSQIVWKITIEAIGISLDGGNTYPYGLDISGTAILERIYTVGLNADYINSGSITAKDDQGNIVFSVNIATGDVLINKGVLKVGNGYINTDGSFSLASMKSAGENNEDVLINRALFVTYGVEIFGGNRNNEPYMDYCRLGADGEVRSGLDYSARISNTGDSEISFFGMRYDEDEVPAPCTVIAGSFVNTSDRRLKRNVAMLDDETCEKFILGLKPVSYIYRNDPEEMRHHGFIYDEVEAAMDGQWGLLSKATVGKEVYGALSMNELIADAIATIQRQNKKIEKLQETVNKIIALM